MSAFIKRVGGIIRCEAVPSILLTIFALKRSGGLVTGLSNIDYLHTGNQLQKLGRSVYQFFQY